MPRVSVLLPARNAAATVDAAIASIRAQTFADWELVIVDDGSADATAERARRHAAEDARVRLLRRPQDGLVAALNTGLSACAAPLIARMDADDLAHPDRLGEQVAALETDPHLGLVSCLVEYGGDRVANLGYALHVDWLNALVTHEDILLNRFVESPFAHPSVMFRRDLVAKFGTYLAGDFPEDYELWLRWLDAGVRMAKVPRTLLHWNDAPSRLSRTDDRYDPDRFFRLKARWLARHLARTGATAPTGSARRQVWVWGAGRPTRKRAAYLNHEGVPISGYIDIDAKKTGRTVNSCPVVSPDQLPPPAAAFVLGYVSSRGARDLIRATLRTHGYREGPDFLMCA